MKYKITEILPAQIKVEFENGSWALVTIPPEASPEEIDDAVSNYDPDFLPNPKDLINKNITIGEERNSRKKVIPPVSNNSEETPESKPDVNELKPTLSFGTAPIVNVLFLADYYAQKGDTRLKDIIVDKIQSLVENPSFSLDQLIADCAYDPDDIMRQAEEELNAEQS